MPQEMAWGMHQEMPQEILGDRVDGRILFPEPFPEAFHKLFPKSFPEVFTKALPEAFPKPFPKPIPKPFLKPIFKICRSSRSTSFAIERVKTSCKSQQFLAVFKP